MKKIPLVAGAVALVLSMGASAKGCDSVNADGSYGDGEYPVGYSIEAGTYKAVARTGRCRVTIEHQHSTYTSLTNRFRITVDDDNVKLSGGCRWKKISSH